MGNIYKIFIVSLALLTVNCTRNSIEPMNITEEGLPAELNISLGSADMETRNAGLTPAQEKAINSVQVLIFDGNGNVVSKDYFNNFNVNTGIQGLVTKSGTNMTIYVIANLSSTNANVTPPTMLFNNVSTINDLKNLKVYTVGGDIELNGNILMYGVKENVTIYPSPTASSATITLNYVASKIRVNFVADIPVGDQVDLIDWKLINFAKISYLIGSPSDAVNPSNASDFLSSTSTFRWEDTVFDVGGVQKPGKSTVFYLFENRRGGRVTGSPTDTDPRNKNLYAPNRATAIVARGYYKSATVEKGITATIFLGANSYNDYNLERSKEYTYMITVKGINEIDIDSRVDGSNYGYQVDIMNTTLDSHYDWRPLRIGSFSGTSKIEILDENNNPVPTNFWLKASSINLMAFVNNGSGTYIRPTYTPSTDMKTVIDNISFTDASQMTFKTYYVYADEFVSQEGGSRTAKIRVSSTQNAISGTLPIDITITQKGYQLMGNVGMRKFSLLGAILQPIADYRLIVENQEESSLALTPGAASGTEKTTTMQWAFKGTKMQPVSITTLFDYYKRNGYDNSYNLVYTLLGELRPPYGRNSESAISEQNHNPIFNSYAARYCFEKNRDLDGNGKIEGSEIKWYLPSLDEIILIYVGEPSLSQITGEKISTDPYHSSTENQTVEDDMGLRFSMGRTGTIPKITAMNVRCVRALNAISTTSPNVAAGAIVSSGFKSTSLRSVVVSRPVPFHVNTDDINKKVSPNFVVAKSDYNASSTPTVTWATACGWTNAANSSSGTGVINNPTRGCQRFSEGSFGEGTWRTPTQKELMLMYLMNKELVSSILGFTPFEVNTYYWSSTMNSATEAFAMDFSAGVMYNRDKSSSYRVRCVRDN